MGFKKQTTSNTLLNSNNNKISLKDDTNFPNFKLDNIKEFTEDPEITLVREEREREWKRIEEEKLKKATLETIKAEILRNENRLKSKEIDGRKITFDVNGGVITIKNVNIERLANEFLQAKYSLAYLINKKL